jgi:4'-phosphopantetheinyl transferase
LALLIHNHLSQEIGLGVWKVEEDDRFFEERLSIFPEEKLELAQLKGRKRTEWLSSRHLLHVLSNVTDRYSCLKDEYGKPFLQGFDRSISLSHSSEYTAALIADMPCGIDVQVIVPKISRIVSKFIRTDEFEFIPATANDILYYHTIWGAKESMYKAYGKKSLDFKKDMQVFSFNILNDKFTLKGKVSKGDFLAYYQIHCQIIHSIILVYAIQEPFSI